jgi:butyrate kinase
VPAAETYRVLAVSPGSTSTKVALYENDRCAHESEVAHGIAPSRTPTRPIGLVGQLAELVDGVLDQWGQGKVDAVAAPGGFLPRPAGELSRGVYLVAERREGGVVVDEAIVSAAGDQPESEGATALAAALAQKLGVPALIVAPAVIDEFTPEAELSGYEPIVRRSTSNPLSLGAAVSRAAQDIGLPPDNISLVVAHLDHAITVAAIRSGKIIDSTSAEPCGGPFTSRRAGDLPMGGLIDLCYSGRFTREELIEELTMRGGLWSYLGTDRMEDIEKRIADGDEGARLAADAMVYQIAKEIGKAFVAAGCDVDAIVLTGRLTRSKWVQAALRRRVVRLSPVIVYQGSLDMAALAADAIDVLSGRRQPLRYPAPGRPETSEER